MNMPFAKGYFVELNNLLAVVVGTEIDGIAPEDHVALWFGDKKGGTGLDAKTTQAAPEVWTVPSEYCKKAKSPIIRH